MFRILFALIILLSVSTAQATVKHSHISQNEILGKMKEAALAIEPMNGYITQEKELISYTGVYFGEICTLEKKDNCISFTNSEINYYIGLDGNHKDAQYSLYSEPNIVINGFKLTRAMIIDGKVTLIAYENNLTKEDYLFEGASKIDEIITSDKEFKKKSYK